MRSERRRAGESLVEAAPGGSLTPWREVVAPHAAVASGRYQQAELAADLWQVHRGEGGEEYRDPSSSSARRSWPRASVGSSSAASDG